MIKAIMFDLDGTLIGQKKASSMVLSQFYLENKARFGNMEQKEFFNNWFKAGRKNLPDFLKGEITFEDKMITQILEFFQNSNNKIVESKASEIFNKFLPIYEENIILFDDVIPCLEYLSREKYQLGIITNGHSKDQREKLRRFNLEKYFPTVIISGEIGFAKPSAEIFLECANILKLSPNEIMYIGDMVEMDIIGANEVGIRGIWLNRESEKNHTDILSISTLNELKNLVE